MTEPHAGEDLARRDPARGKGMGRGKSRHPGRFFLVVRVLGAIGTIAACYAVGEAVAGSFELPIPGSVLGMVLFFGVLGVLPAKYTRRTAVPVAERLVNLIPFLLVPAAVGVVAHLSDIARDAPALVAAVVGGWVTTLFVTAIAARFLLRGTDKRGEA
ncbi:CidA/LrgA family protein [Mycetocola zhadangensis]|uniref:CidA/LrgA family protein n=1 Tax=Mycetocola zhadangensis TaxID=1164595 RepID=UPI003A4D2567